MSESILSGLQKIAYRALQQHCVGLELLIERQFESDGFQITGIDPIKNEAIIRVRNGSFPQAIDSFKRQYGRALRGGLVRIKEQRA